MTKTVPTFQVVGYRNSGKTTVMQALIHYFTNQSLAVGTIKHHGHGSELQFPVATDSGKHYAAGAMVSAVHGEHELQLFMNKHETDTLEKLIKWYHSFPVDLILIEGHKLANYPKMVLLRNHSDYRLLEQLTNIHLVGSLDKDLLEGLPYETFSLNNVEEVLPLISRHIIVE